MRAFRNLARLPLLLALLLLGTVAHASGSSATLSWTPPATYTDGTIIAPAEILSYAINYMKGGIPATVVVNAPATSTTVIVPCGSTSFTITVTTTASAVYPNSTSAASAPVPYATGIACVPNPPTNLKAQ